MKKPKSGLVGIVLLSSIALAGLGACNGVTDKNYVRPNQSYQQPKSVEHYNGNQKDKREWFKDFEDMGESGVGKGW